MNYEALVIFALVSSITPGPNNIMLWGSGMNFGLVRTIPHALGVNVGFASLVFATSVGLGAVFLRYEAISMTLKVLGTCYLLYLAYKVATSDSSQIEGGQSRAASASKPFTFMQAAAFQYLNPKAWVMGITAASAFLVEDMSVVAGALRLTAIFALVNLPCIITWVVAGNAIGRLLTNPMRRKVVNAALGLLLVGTAYLINV